MQGASAVEKANEAKDMAADVIEKSKVVCATSQRAIEIARKQRRAKEVATRATEKALRSFRRVLFTGPDTQSNGRRFGHVYVGCHTPRGRCMAEGNERGSESKARHKQEIPHAKLVE